MSVCVCVRCVCVCVCVSACVFCVCVVCRVCVCVCLCWWSLFVYVFVCGHTSGMVCRQTRSTPQAKPTHVLVKGARGDEVAVRGPLDRVDITGVPLELLHLLQSLDVPHTNGPETRGVCACVYMRVCMCASVHVCVVGAGYCVCVCLRVLPCVCMGLCRRMSEWMTGS